MTAVATSVAWPLKGLGRFLANPRLWPAPIACAALTALAFIALVVGVTTWAWPNGTQSWFISIWRGIAAIGLGVSSGLALWLVLGPLLMSLAFDLLARRVQTLAGAAPTVGESWRATLASTIRVVIGTLPLRLLCLVVGVTASFIAGPLGVLVALYLASYLAVIDSIDVALAARGLDGATRLAAIRRERPHLRVVAATAAGLHLLLAPTVIGLALWLPALVCGAAQAVLAWPEVTPELLTASDAPTMPAITGGSQG